MKTSLRTIALAACMMAASFTNAQSFQKGSIFFDLGLGLGIYNTTSYNYQDSVTKTGKAGAIIIPVTFEYGIGNRIGIGAQLVTQNYLSSKDSLSNYKPTANTKDINVFGNFHFVRAEHTDLFAGLTIGLSAFKYNANNLQASTLDAAGSYFDIHLGGRFLFTKHFGMIASLRFPSFKYIQGLAQDNNGNQVNFDFKLSGVVIGTGVTFKI